jgi:hypothetical protein
VPLWTASDVAWWTIGSIRSGKSITIIGWSLKQYLIAVSGWIGYANLT